MRTAGIAAAIALCGALAASRPCTALDLEGALRQVAAANPTLAARSAMVEAARRRASTTGAWPNPMVELGVVNVPTNGRFDMDMMTMKMVGISQRVPLFGASGLQRRSAAEAGNAEAASAEQIAFALFGQTWEAYADVFFSREVARHEEEHRAVMDRMVQTALAGYESGRGGHHDVLGAEAERARVLVDLAAFRAEESQARVRLRVLMGLDPSADRDSLAPPPMPDVPATPETWLAAITPEHPRLRALGAESQGYAFAARAARRGQWPDLELRGSYGFRERLDGAPVAQDDMFSASVGLMLPIFGGSSGRAEGREMDAMARARAHERDAAELELRGELLATHAQALSAQQRIRLLADTVIVVQRRALDASWSAYTAGEGDLARVLEDGHMLLAEQIGMARARQDLVHAQARFVALTGRGDLLGVTMPQVKEEGR
jgi:outer membrane protein TolC